MKHERKLARELISLRRLMMLSVLSIAVCLSAGCYEEDMKVSIDQQIPPTFSLTGSGNLVFFGVWEVASENHNRVPAQRDGDMDTLLWRIHPDGLTADEKVIRRLPRITYGSAPAGFVQKFPEVGHAPELVEGKIYSAGGPATNANGGFVWFTIKEGKIIKVDPPGGT